MDGYSVTEAASVLGVPTERVWELLARGVLLGAPEGETGMRVYLQPRPAPVRSEPSDAAPRGNGHDRDGDEASPFRELLTEFRNLTERYGQALLALGEARGEVASLRGRVDLLEARLDLRLPGGSPMPEQPPAAWTPPPVAEPPAPRVEPHSDTAAAAAGTEPAADEHPQTEEGGRRRRRRGQHPASDEIAEALARADDPSPAELPGAAEAAAAFAALRDESGTADAEEFHAVLPRELPAAEAMDLVDEIASGPEPGAVDVEPESAAAEPEPAAPEPDPAADATQAEATSEGASADAPAADLGDEPPEPWDRERYSPHIEEPDWIPEEVKRPGAAADVDMWPSIMDDRVRAASTGIDDRPGAEDDWPAEPDLVHRREVEEEASMWRSTVGDARERLGLDAEPDGTEGAAGAADPATDEAASELEVTGVAPTPAPAPAGDAPASPEATAEATPVLEPPATAARPGPSATAMPTIGTTGTASRAYRRLRRIFPG